MVASLKRQYTTARQTRSTQSLQAARVLAGVQFPHSREPSSTRRWGSVAQPSAADACTIASRFSAKPWSCFRSASFSSESLITEMLSGSARVSGISIKMLRTAASGSLAELGFNPLQFTRLFTPDLTPSGHTVSHFTIRVRGIEMMIVDALKNGKRGKTLNPEP